MQLLTIAVQAVLIGWLVFVLVLAGRMALRTLDARRRRRAHWAGLVQSWRTSVDALRVTMTSQQAGDLSDLLNTHPTLAEDYPALVSLDVGSDDE